MPFDSQAALKRNVQALLIHWGLTAAQASRALGQRDSWLSELTRGDRCSITLKRLDQVATVLASILKEHGIVAEPRHLIDDDWSPENKT